MPKDQAMDFVVAEYSRGLAKERPPRDPADIAAQASQLLDDFLDREKIERHSVPSETRPLLMLLAEGVHLYPEELETIAEYVRSRQEHLQGGSRVSISLLLCTFWSIALQKVDGISKILNFAQNVLMLTWGVFIFCLELMSLMGDGNPFSK